MTERTYVPGDVTVRLSAWDAEGAVTQMRLSNDGERWSDAIPYGTETQWELSAGDGPKTVYAQFRDEAGNWSESVTAHVWRKEQPPALVGDIQVRTNRYGARLAWTT